MKHLIETKNVLAQPVIEYRSMPTLLEQRNNLVTELEGLVSTAKTENRSMSDEDITNFNRVKAEIEKIDKTLKAEMESRSFIIDKPLVQTNEETRAIQEAEDKLLRFIRGEERALDVANNGAIIPQILANRIITKVRELCPIYARATVFNVGGDLIFPKFDINSILTDYIGDFPADLTPANGNFTTVKLQNFIIGSHVIISRSLMNRTDFGLVDFIVNQMSQSIANFLEKQLLVGVGTTAMTGIFVDASATSVTAGSATAIALDDIISLQMAVPEAYQAQSAFIMSKNVFTAIRKLKDTTGMPILLQNGGNVREGFGWELLGKPVFISQNAPSVIATTNKVIAYGDYSGLFVKLAQNVEIQLLMEKFATQHGIGIVGHVEADSRIVEDGKIAVLKMA